MKEWKECSKIYNEETYELAVSSKSFFKAQYKGHKIWQLFWHGKGDHDYMHVGTWYSFDDIKKYMCDISDKIGECDDYSSTKKVIEDKKTKDKKGNK